MWLPSPLDPSLDRRCESASSASVSLSLSMLRRICLSLTSSQFLRRNTRCFTTKLLTGTHIHTQTGEASAVTARNRRIACVPLTAQQLHVEMREKAADVARILLLHIRNKKGVASSVFERLLQPRWKRLTPNHVNSPLSDEKIRPVPSAGLKRSQGNTALAH